MAAKGVVCVRVGSELLARVDEAAARAGGSRSAWMLKAFEMALALPLPPSSVEVALGRSAWSVYG